MTTTPAELWKRRVEEYPRDRRREGSAAAASTGAGSAGAGRPQLGTRIEAPARGSVERLAELKELLKIRKEHPELKDEVEETLSQVRENLEELPVEIETLRCCELPPLFWELGPGGLSSRCAPSPRPSLALHVLTDMRMAQRPNAPAPAAAGALMPTIQPAPTPMLVEEDGVVTEESTMETERNESPVVLRLSTINKYRGIYISCYIIDVLLA